MDNTFEMRINNIGIKYLQERYEILKYYPNSYYQKEDDYVKIGEDTYITKEESKTGLRGCVIIGKSLFETPECCSLLAHFDDDVDDNMPNLIWCGNRPLSLTKDEFEDFIECTQYGYKKLTKDE